MPEQTYICPISGNTITPVKVQQHGILTWYLCCDPCHHTLSGCEWHVEVQS